MAGTGLPTHHVDVCVVNECLLEALVEEDDDGVHQVASVRDAGQETPDAAREQLVYRTCGGEKASTPAAASPSGLGDTVSPPLPLRAAPKSVDF